MTLPPGWQKGRTTVAHRFDEIRQQLATRLDANQRIRELETALEAQSQHFSALLADAVRMQAELDEEYERTGFQCGECQQPVMQRTTVRHLPTCRRNDYPEDADE